MQDLDKLGLTDTTLSQQVSEGAEIDIKYSGYLKRQAAQIEQFKRQTKRLLPQDVNYHNITTISQEAREKLSDARPKSLGHASELPGVSKADLTALLVWLKLHGEQNKAHTIDSKVVKHAEKTN